MTGLSFHVVALTRAPVTVVQPIIAAGIVFLVLLAALILHERPRPREFVGIALYTEVASLNGNIHKITRFLPGRG